MDRRKLYLPGAAQKNSERVMTLMMYLCAVLFFATLPLPSYGGNFTLTIMHSGETYAQVQPVDWSDDSTCPPNTTASNCLGGVARRATFINNVRAQVNNSILIDTGSLFQGSLYWTQFQSSIFNFYYQVMGYQVMNLDRRMFFGGPQTLGAFLRNVTNMIAVSSNLNVQYEPQLNGLVKPYAIIDVAGERVGITGFVQADLADTVLNAGNISTIDELTGLRIAVMEMIEQGVNKIIAMVPTDSLLPNVSATVPGIDIAITSAEFYVNNITRWASLSPFGTYPKVVPLAWGSPMLVVDAGTYGTFIGRLDVTFNDNGVIQSYSGDSYPLDSSYAYDPVVQANVFEKYAELQASLDQVVGSFQEPLPYVVQQNPYKVQCREQECLLGNWAADVFAQSTGTTLAFVNGGSIRASLPAANVTRGDVVTAYPFSPSTTLLTMSLTGDVIWNMLENSVSDVDSPTGTGRFLSVNSNMKFLFNRYQAVGYRVVNAEVRDPTTGTWSRLDNTTAYTICLPDFIVQGGDGYTMVPVAAIGLKDGVANMEDVLLTTLNTQSPINVQIEGRITETNETRAEFNQPPPAQPTYENWSDPAAIIFMILSILLSFIILGFAIFFAVFYKEPAVRDTNIYLTMAHLLAMFVSCYIIFIFLGVPPDSICAVQPWTSFMFTFVYGLLVAKEVSLVLQWLTKQVKHEEGILHIKYKWWFFLGLFLPVLVVQTSYLIIWMAVDYPNQEVESTVTGSASYYYACRSSPEIPWVVVLFSGFGILLLVGIVCGIFLIPILTMWREAKRVSIGTLLSSVTVIATVVTVNATQAVPQAPFILLAAGILITLVLILVSVYVPLAYLLLWSKKELGSARVEVNKVVNKDSFLDPDKDNDGLDDI